MGRYLVRQVAIVSCYRPDVHACVVYTVAAFQRIVYPRLLRLMSETMKLLEKLIHSNHGL
jgi:hypothetical protein